MPESSSRKKKSAKPAGVANLDAKIKDHDGPTPAWFLRLMAGFLILGLVWILVFYISGAQYPLGSAFSGINPALNLGNWNIAIGFGLVLVGFGMATRWK